MTGPGKGRYTDYVGSPSAGLSSVQSRLHKIFNTNLMVPPGPGLISSEAVSSDRGLFYGASIKSNQTDNNQAAVSAISVYVESIVSNLETKDIAKDTSTSTKKSLVYYNGNDTNSLPNTANDSMSKPESFSVGSPANSYIPDLTSPGATADNKVKLSPPTIVNRIKPESVKPELTIPTTPNDKQNLGTLSPSDAAPIVGILSVGTDLTMGSSKKQ